MFETPIKFFLWANTAQGAVGFQEEVYDGREGWKTCILKSGPGMGKNQLLQNVFEKIRATGQSAQLMVCPTDPSTLDGILLPERKYGVLDGSSPHGMARNTQFLHSGAPYPYAGSPIGSPRGTDVFGAKTGMDQNTDHQKAPRRRSESAYGNPTPLGRTMSFLRLRRDGNLKTQLEDGVPSFEEKSGTRTLQPSPNNKGGQICQWISTVCCPVKGSGALTAT